MVGSTSLVGGLEHEFYCSIYWECHHPNWRTHICQRVGQPPTSSPAMPWWTLVDVWKNRSPTCCNNFDDDSGNGKHKKERIVNPRNRIVETWNCISPSNSLFGAHICYLFTFVAAFMLRNQQLDDEAQPTNQPTRERNYCNSDSECRGKQREQKIWL